MARITAQLLLGIGLLAPLACGDSDPARRPPGEAAAGALPRGLWVLCEGSQRVLEHPERIQRLVEDAGELGASDLFVQVYRGGRAWFDSSHADAEPYRAQREASGIDTLAELIARAHAAGLRVHAWVNVLSLARNREAPLVKDLGRDAVMVDRFGRSVLEFPNFDVPPPDRRYYRMGTPALWLDPAVPSVAARLSVTFAELLTRYPELDGLHFDYIRYPDVLPFAPGSRFGVGLDFGYGAETGLEAPFRDSLANANQWDSWRRDQLTGLLVALRMAARTAHPEVQLSAAVIPHVDRAYLALGQDWRRWLEDGLLEFAVPMAYTLDDRILRYQVESLAHVPLGGRIWIGLGTWLFARHPQRALEQIRIARAAGAAGESLFSYDSIAEAPALREALIGEASKGG
jgi:uncharacterized lipoprotein YddW (UPF0748 family)